MSGFSISIQIDPATYRAAERKLAGFPRAIERATSRALQRAAVGVQGDTAKMARRDLNVSITNLKRYVRFPRIKTDATSATVSIVGERIPLSKFKDVRPSPWGVAVKLMPRGKMVLFKHSFIGGVGKALEGGEENIPAGVRVKKSGWRIFWRAMDGSHRVARLPIEAITGPSVLFFVNNEFSLALLSKLASDRLLSTFRHEVEYRYQKGMEVLVEKIADNPWVAA